MECEGGRSRNVNAIACICARTRSFLQLKLELGGRPWQRAQSGAHAASIHRESGEGERGILEPRGESDNSTITIYNILVGAIYIDSNHSPLSRRQQVLPSRSLIQRAHSVNFSFLHTTAAHRRHGGQIFFLSHNILA